MNLERLGTILVEDTLVVDEAKIRRLADAIGTATALQTALLVPFFGPTAAGQDSVVAALEMDLSKALQGGQSYEWHRPFKLGETVQLKVICEDLLVKGANHLAMVKSEYRAADGELIQRQRTTFLERGAAL